MEDTELGPIVVNGKPVELPDILSVTLDEAEDVLDLYGVDLSMIGENGAGPSRLKLYKALLHVAVARADADLDRNAIREAVGAVSFADLNSALTGGEDDAGPPVSTRDSGGNGSSAGRVFVTSSTLPVLAQPPTFGTPDSGISE